MHSDRCEDAELIRAIAGRLGLAEDLVRTTLDSFYGEILTGVAEGREVHLKEFAAFMLQERKPRTLKHPKTGRMVFVPHRRSIKSKFTRAFKERARRKLETVLGVSPAETGAVPEVLELLTQRSYSTLRVPSLEAARQVLTSRSVTAVLIGADLPAGEVDSLARSLRQQEANAIASLLVLGSDAPNAPPASFRVVANRWIGVQESCEAIAKTVEAEVDRLSEERGYFQQQVLMDLASTSAAVDECVRFLEERLEKMAYGEEDRFKLTAALREAAENGIRHGNRYDASRKLTAEFLVDREKITFSVQDEGSGFDFASFLKNTPKGSAVQIARANIAQGKTGGLGIKLLQECLDEVRYTPPGNKLTVTKYLPKPK